MSPLSVSPVARALVCVVAAWACVGVGQAAASTLSWGAPAGIDDYRPPSGAYQTDGVSCPSVSFCAVTDLSGDVYTSDRPSDPDSRWSYQQVDPGVLLRDISCPSSSFCAAAGTDGQVFTSADPAAGDWTSAALPSARAVACPSASLCVATSGLDVYVSTNPIGGAATWSTATVATLGIQRLSCPSVHLCVGVEYGGAVVTSTDPAGGAAAWSEAPVAGLGHGFDVSCASGSFCVVTDDAGHYATSTNPIGGSGAWTTSSFGHFGSFHISCVAVSSCVAINGDVLTSASPAGGTGTWTFDHVSNDGIASVSCPTAAFCLATDDSAAAGKVLLASNPAGGAGGWIEKSFGDTGYYSLFAAACPADNTCLVGDESAGALSSTDPTGGLSAWSLGDLTSAGVGSILAISCSDSSFCALTDDSGHVAISGRPTSGTWQVSTIDPGHALYGISCPNAALCIAVDDAGRVLSSTHPSDGAGAWVTAAVDGTTALLGVSCPTPGLCVAVDNGGQVAVSTAPTGGASAWTITRLPGAAALTAVSCPSAVLCVAVDSSGGVFSSTNPDWASPSWEYGSIPGAVWTGVSCPSPSLCVGVTLGGRIMSNASPSTDPGYWSEDENSPGDPLEAVDCTGTPLCVVVDGFGYVRAAKGVSLPYNTAAPVISGTAAPGETVECLAGKWSGDGVTLTYQWRLEDGRLVGGDKPTLAIGSYQADARLSCSVTAKNGSGSATATSGNEMVSGALRRPTIDKVVIAGQRIVGQPLTCYSSIGYGDSVTHQWFRDGVAIGPPSANETYTPVVADEGHQLTCTLSATNRNGTTSATSDAIIVTEAPAAFVPLTGLVTAAKVKLATLLVRGLPVWVQCSDGCTVRVRLTIASTAASHLGIKAHGGPVLVASAAVKLNAAGKRLLRLHLFRGAAGRIAHHRPAKVTLALRPSEVDGWPIKGATVLTILR